MHDLHVLRRKIHIHLIGHSLELVDKLDGSPQNNWYNNTQIFPWSMVIRIGIIDMLKAIPHPMV